jgi:hypothetical protein
VAWLAAVLVFVVVVAIAAIFIVREAKRMTRQPPPVLFSMDEAFDWVVENVPDEVAATLTPHDVRRILGFQAEYFAQKGVSEGGIAEIRPGLAVVGGDETVNYILERAAATGEAYIPEQVYPVVETQLEYLRAIGAVSTAVDEPVDPDLDRDSEESDQ